MNKIWFHLIAILIIGVMVLWTSGVKQDLYFVDAGRFADIARNIYLDNVFSSNFSYITLTPLLDNGWAVNIPPVHIYSIVVSYALFGVTDYAVIFASQLFFILGAVVVYLLGRKVFNPLTGLLSTIFYLFTPELYSYAHDGASESIFIFEILVIIYLLYIRKNWAFLLAGAFCGLAMYTKLQSIVMIPLLLIWGYLLYPNLKQLLLLLVGPIVVYLLNKSGLFFHGYRPESLPFYLSVQQSALHPGDDLVRSGKTKELGVYFIFENLKVIFSKLFYNSYNFFKIIAIGDHQLPTWLSAWPGSVYLFSQIKLLTAEEKDRRIFRIMTLVLILAAMTLAAITSPHIRYLHPYIPLALILVADLILTVYKKFELSRSAITVATVLIIALFFVLPFFGKFILDQRFINKVTNIDRPYAQKNLGLAVGENSNSKDIVVTNLDTWGAWYGERRTLLIPPTIAELVELDKRTKIDKIFLTDYQKDNPDHPLNKEWDELYLKGSTNSNDFIQENFRLVKVATVSAEENYENTEYHYKVWVRK